jgi:hypothetical protein
MPVLWLVVGLIPVLGAAGHLSRHLSLPLSEELTPTGDQSSSARQGSLMIFTSHHKTGTSVIGPLASALVDSSSKNIVRVDESSAGIKTQYWPNSTVVRRALGAKKSDDKMAVLINPHAGTWPPADYPEVRCLLHVTRKPVDLVVSAYLYHMRMGMSHARCSHGPCEAWLYEPTTDCPSMPGVSHFDKLRFAPNETAGLLCQLEQSKGTIRQMQHMEREVQRRPGVGISMDLDEWHDSSTAIHKVLAFCGVDELTERTLRGYNRAYARMSTSPHVNHDDDRAERLRAFLYDSGAAEGLTGPL